MLVWNLADEGKLTLSMETINGDELRKCFVNGSEHKRACKMEIKEVGIRHGCRMFIADYSISMCTYNRISWPLT